MEENSAKIMSRARFAELQDELERLRTIDRPRLTQAIKAAREEGDLRENAGFDAAKNEQGLLESRIRELEKRLEDVVFLDEVVEAHPARAGLGTRVLVRDRADGEEEWYALVGPADVNLRAGRISVQSPVGAALVGQAIGAQVMVQTPGAARALEILSIERAL